MKIDKNKLDETQLNYLAAAEKLQAELIKQGFLATRIEKEKDDRCTFYVIFFDGTHDYRISRNYRGEVIVTRHKNIYYDNVSHYTRHDVYKKHFDRINNIKVITAKKLQAHIDAENAYHIEMQNLNDKAEDKTKSFLMRVHQLELENYTVRYNHTHNKEKITGGYITRNGIELHFEISQDGYISKKLTINTDWKETGRDDIADFIALSDNAYKK